MLGLHHSCFAQDNRINARLPERSEPFQADNVVFLAENVSESPLRHAAMQRHLSAFEPAQHARTAARTLTFMAASGGLAHPRAHAAPYSLLVFCRFLRRVNIREIHKQVLRLSGFHGSAPEVLRRAES